MQIVRDWFKSSASTGANNCLQARIHASGAVDVRDSKQGEQGPVLQFTRGEWEAFLEGAANKEFNLD